MDALKWISWAYVVLFFAGIALWLQHQRRVIREELAAEADSGLVSAEEAARAASFTDRTRRELGQVRSGDLEGAHQTSSLCRELAELAFTKRRLRDLEDPRDQVELHRDRVRDVLATEDPAPS
jgi:hypothetical protein